MHEGAPGAALSGYAELADDENGFCPPQSWWLETARWIFLKIAMLAVGCFAAYLLYIFGAFGAFMTDDPNAPSPVAVVAICWMCVFWIPAALVLIGTLAAIVTHNGIFMVPCLWPYEYTKWKRSNSRGIVDCEDGFTAAEQRTIDQ